MNPLIISTLREFNRVYFQASDPGAFYIMEPVFEEAKRKGLDCHWIFEGWCAETKYGKLDFIDGKEFMENSANDFSSACILQGIRINYKREHEWINFAGKAGLYSIVFIDYWNNYFKSFYDFENSILYLPNRIWIMDDLSYNELTAELGEYIDIESDVDIEIVGHPGIEKTGMEIGAFSREHLYGLRQKYNISNRKAVLLVLQPLRDDNRSAPLGFDEYDVIRYFFRNFDLNSSKVLIRPHPRQRMEDIASVVGREAEKANTEYEYVGDECINNLLAISDEVVGTSSTVLITAYKLGIPIKSLMPIKKPECFKNLPTIIHPFVCT